MPDKQTVRKRMGALRRRAGSDAQEGLLRMISRALNEERRVLTIGTYQPIGSEPDINSLLKTWSQSDSARALALPWCTDRDAASMEYRIWKPGEPLMPDAADIPGPGRGASVIPDALLIPCLGWTRSRRRLGYGGGYFDRYISKLLEAGVSPRLLGVAYSVNEVDESLFEPHDLPLDLIITDIGIF